MPSSTAPPRVNGNAPDRSLTRQQLRGFDKEAVEMVMAAQDAGLTVRMSTNGHVIIRNTETNQSMAVQQRMRLGNRGAQNARAAFKRLMREVQPDTPETPQIPETPKDDPMTVATTRKPQIVDCPVPGCEDFSGTREEFAVHAAEQEHVLCPEPGCGQWIKTRNGVGPHRRFTHVGYRDGEDTPWTKGAATKRKAKDAAPEAEAAPEPEAEPAPETPTQVTLGTVLEFTPLTPAALNPAHDPEDTLTQIHALLGCTAQAEVERLRTENGELKAKLALLREALEV